MQEQSLSPKIEHGDRILETANEIYAEVLHRKLQNSWTDEDMDLLILTTIGLLDLVKHVWQYKEMIENSNETVMENKYGYRRIE